jgi:hypothetical protein
MCTALCGREVDSTIVRWIRVTLGGRLATATLNHVSVRVAVARGCQQGGVLSPLLWCFVVDVLVARLNRGGVYCQGYLSVGRWEIPEHGVGAHAEGSSHCRHMVRRSWLVCQS